MQVRPLFPTSIVGYYQVLFILFHLICILNTIKNFFLPTCTILCTQIYRLMASMKYDLLLMKLKQLPPHAEESCQRRDLEKGFQQLENHLDDIKS